MEQQEKLYTKWQMFLFAGYVMGKKKQNPEADIYDIHKEFDENLPKMEALTKLLYPDDENI